MFEDLGFERNVPWLVSELQAPSVPQLADAHLYASALRVAPPGYETVFHNRAGASGAPRRIYVRRRRTERPLFRLHCARGPLFSKTQIVGESVRADELEAVIIWLMLHRDLRELVGFSLREDPDFMPALINWWKAARGE